MTPRVACFTGRFQPFHNQHLEVIIGLSEEFNKIIIGVTNPDLTDLQAHVASQHRHTASANPFSLDSRIRIIEDSLAHLRESTLKDIEISIEPFDLAATDSWSVPTGTVFALRIFSVWEESKLNLFADRGFETLELPAPKEKLSASEIRRSLHAGDSNWENWVAPGSMKIIRDEWEQHLLTKMSA